MTKIAEFRAGTGRTVTITSKTLTGVELEISGLGTRTKLGLGDVETLREFFQADRDEELGRWRWPENPDYVVVPQPDNYHNDGKRWVYVYDERMMGRGSWYCSDSSSKGVRGSQPLHDAAHDYFASRGEKPWHEAQQNELWELRIEHCHGPEVYRFAQDSTCADSKVFRPVNNPKRVFFDPKSPLITAGRRIWPEGAE